MRHGRPGFVLAGLCAVGLLVGCSDGKRLTLEGNVSYKGEPVTAGTVRIHGPGEHLATAVIQPDGTFIVSDVPSGEVRVSVEEDPTPAKLRRMAGAPQGGNPIPGLPAAGKFTPIPPKYRDPSTSGLVFTITAAMKRLDLKLD
jgi:hypothetical protein